MEDYPIINAKVGSVVKDGKIQTGTLFETPITSFNSFYESSKYMTGQSRYYHNSKMNKGSFGVSGSYGVSGIAKATGSISGYVGHGTVRSGKEVNINYNAYHTAGVEWIDINKLDLMKLLLALKENPKTDLISVLNKYNKLFGNGGLVQSSNCRVEDIFDGGLVEAAFKEWSASVDNFYTNYGTGLVLAVYWGSFGWVNMKMVTSSADSNWNYGASSEFSYAGVSGSASVKATYEGNQSSGKANVEVSVTSDQKGRSIEDTIKTWENKFSDKAYSELIDVKILDKCPPLGIPSDIAPGVPAFVEPNKEEKITDSFDKIKDLKGLKALAIAQAFEKEKKVNGQLDLATFLAQIEKDASGLDNIPSDFNDISTSPSAPDSSERAARQIFRSADEPKTDKASKDLSENFVALGVMIYNWADIFPWLTTAYFNNIEDSKSIMDILRWRTLIQDFQTLSILYYTASATGLILDKNWEDAATQIADHFESALQVLQEKSDEVSYDDNINMAFKTLTLPQAIKIHEIWDSSPILRSAELGFGIIDNSQPSLTVKEYGSTITIKKQPNVISLVETTRCEYSGNGVAFKSYVKVLPIILPNGEIRVFNDKGYFGTLILLEKDNEKAWPSNAFHVNPETDKFKQIKNKKTNILKFKAYPFTINETDRCLQHGRWYKLYPIPYAAAKGVSWKGGAAGSGSLASFEDLNETINKLKKELKALKAVSFSCENFKASENPGSMTLNHIRTKGHYLGIFPELEGRMSWD